MRTIDSTWFDNRLDKLWRGTDRCPNYKDKSVADNPFGHKELFLQDPYSFYDPYVFCIHPLCFARSDHIDKKTYQKLKDGSLARLWKYMLLPDYQGAKFPETKI